MNDCYSFVADYKCDQSHERNEKIMAKRKAEFDAVEKYSKTPKKNLKESEFSAEFSSNFSGGEDPYKGFNRNSELGRKGRS